MAADGPGRSDTGPNGPGSARPRSGAKSVVTNRPFVTFAITQAISLFGDKLDYMALLAMFAWFSTVRDWDASRAIATLGVVSTLPAVIFGPVAGVFVDRRDRRRVMIGADAARALLVFVMPFVALATGSLPMVFVLAFAVFTAGLLFQTARMSVIPVLVDGESKAHSGRLLAANSFMNLTGRVATLAGVVLGGLIVDWNGWTRIGIAHPWTAGFYLDAATYLVSVFGLVLIYRKLEHALPPPARVVGGETALARVIDRVRHVRMDITDAWRFALKTPSVLFAYSSIIGLTVIAGAFLVLFVPLVQGYADTTGLGLGTRGVGYVAGIGSLGLIASSVGYGMLGHRVRKHHVLLAAFGALGVSAAVLGLTKSFALIAPAVFLGGLALSPVLIGVDTLLHETVPAESRGRIFSTKEWLLHLSFGASSFLFGQLTRLAPKRTLLVAVGALVMVGTLVGLVLARRRNIG